VPIAGTLSEAERARVDGVLALLHWVAGVSYFKTAMPPSVSCETGAPPPAVAELLDALYSEGLGELAYTNGLAGLPRPSFARGALRSTGPRGRPWPPRRVLVPVGGGKDSVVALEIVRRSGAEVALFSVGDAPTDRTHGRGRGPRAPALSAGAWTLRSPRSTAPAQSTAMSR